MALRTRRIRKLVSQFFASDVIVVGAPLYSFAIPMQLKAWIDRLAQTNHTFKGADKGAVGSATGKTVVGCQAALISRGKALFP